MNLEIMNRMYDFLTYLLVTSGGSAVKYLQLFINNPLCVFKYEVFQCLN